MSKTFVIKELVKLNGAPAVRPVRVPDGSWVLQVKTQTCNIEEREGLEEILSPEEYCMMEDITFKVVGPEPRRYTLARSYERSEKRGCTRMVARTTQCLVGEAPFGVIFEHRENNTLACTPYLRVARQIHKGELGRTVPFQNVGLVTSNNGGSVSRWARVTDILSITGGNFRDLIRTYERYSFSDDSMDVILADSPDKVMRRRPLELRHAELLRRDPNLVWIDEPMVRTALQLHFISASTTVH